MRFPPFFFSLAFILLTGLHGHVHEVEDLAPDALGDSAKAGGYFSALQTSGSFTMMQAGGFEERLGETTRNTPTVPASATRRRRNDHRAVSSSVTNAAKCADPPGSTTGNQDQEQVKGTLDCTSDVYDTAVTSEDCPDNLSTGKFFHRKAFGRGTCRSLTEARSLARRALVANVGAPAGLDKYLGQVTKAFPFKASYTSSNTGGIALKRVTCNSDNVCASYKSVTCITCPTSKGVDLGKYEHMVKDAQLKKFVNNCVLSAFDNPGKFYAQLKADYACSAEDQRETNYWARIL